MLYHVTIIEDGDNPPGVDEDIEKIWARNELGNDTHYYQWSEYDEEDYTALATYIKDNNISGKILIRYWW
jgi:hypothetical protein